MHFLTTRTASIMLAFGIFFTISCTSLKNTESDQQTPAGGAESFEQQLTKLNDQIQRSSSNGQLRLNKAELLVTHARTLTPPSSRLPVYTVLYQTAEEARTHTPGVTSRMDAILERAWTTEHNEAVRLLQVSAQPGDQEYAAITGHLTNATTIVPGNPDSYRLLASAHYSRGYNSDAIHTIQQALAVIADKDNEILFREKLAYLHLESGSGEEAIAIYRDIAAEKPEMIQLRHGLVNALIINGYHEEAATALKELMEEYPARISYQEALAIESYLHFSEKYESLMNGQSADIEPGELLGLLETTNEIYKSLEEDAPMLEELTFNAALFYKHAAQKMEQLTDVQGLTDNDLDQIVTEFRNSAIPYWERLTRINPDNTEYMSNLYELYVLLELTEEARQLEETYNF